MLEFDNPNLSNIEKLHNKYYVRKTDFHSGVYCFSFKLQGNSSVSFNVNPIYKQCSIANINSFNFKQFNYDEARYETSLTKSIIEDIIKICKGLNYTKIFISFKENNYLLHKDLLKEANFKVTDSYVNKRTDNKIIITECVV